MASRCDRLGWRSALAGTITVSAIATAAIALPSPPVQAQLAIDGTLGAESSVITPNQTIRGIPSDLITGGATRGSSLFHSFLEFNVGAGNGVYFDNPAGITNILTRVTGTNPSTILGRLGVLGGANLYLLNPNGIVFGANASLDVQGAFAASTASAIPFGVNGLFSATDPTASNLIEVQPGALFLNALNGQAAIANQATLQAGGDLMLVGSAIANTGSLIAGQNLALNSVGAITNSGTLQSAQALTVTAGSFANAATGTINAGQAIAITASGDLSNAGTVQTAGNLTLTTTAPSSTLSSTGQLLATNGVLTATAAGDATIANVNAQSATLGAANGLALLSSQLTTTGDLTLQAGNTVTIQDAAVSPFNATVGGNLTIQGGQAVVIDTLKNPNSQLSSGGTFNLLTADIADIRGQISTNNLAIAAGRVSITESLLNTTGALAIAAQAGDLQLSDSQLNAGSTFTLNAAGTVKLQDSVGLPLVLSANGDLAIAGNQGVSIQALNNPASLLQTPGNLSLISSNGAVSANIPLAVGGTFSIQASGDINLGDYTGNALNLTTTNGSIFANIIDTSSTTGNGGAVALNASRAIQIGAIDTFSTAGNGGSVSLIAGTTLALGRVDTSSTAGNGGALALVAGGADLTVGDIDTSSTVVNGGRVTLSAARNITTGAIATFSQATNGGNGGAVLATAATGALTVNGAVDASAASGSGGNITFQTAGDILTQGSVDASTVGNLGGNIRFVSSNGAITAQAFLATNGDAGNSGSVVLQAAGNIRTQDVNSSSVTGNGGAIAITSTGGAIDTTAGDILAYVRLAGKDGGAIAFRANGAIAVSTVRSDGGQNGAGADIQLVSDRGGISVVPNSVTNIEGLIDSATYGPGRAGTLTLQALNNAPITLTDSSIIASAEEGATGTAGAILVHGGQIVVDRTEIVSTTPAAGNGGAIDLGGQSVVLRNGTSLDSSTSSSGSGGNIAVTAFNNGTVQIANSTLSSQVLKGASGNGGNLAIAGGTINLSDRATLTTNTTGSGNSGNITLNTGNSGAINLTDVSSIRSDTSGSGSGGTIQLNSKTVSLANSSRITAQVLGTGVGGNIILNAAQTNLTTNSQISTAVDAETATGSGGKIEVNAQNLSVTGGSRLKASTVGLGKAGDIQINASGLIDVSGANAYGLYSGLLSSSEGLKSGSGGNITINTPSNPQGTLRVTDSGFLSTGSRSSAPGGNLAVNANTLQLISGGQLISSTTGNGAAGTINVNATNAVTVSGVNPSFVASRPEPFNPRGSGVVIDTEPNNSFSTAQLIPSSTFSLLPNPTIEFSTTIPHVTVRGTGDDSYDFFAFDVTTANSQGIFDIDTRGNGLDTRIFLFNSVGNLLASNDDANPSLGAGGSSTELDSYLNYTFNTPGRYVLGIGSYAPAVNDVLPGADVLDAGTQYELQLSWQPNLDMNPNEGAASGLFAQSNGVGSAGNLTIRTGDLQVLEGGKATVSSTRTGNAGNLDVSARTVTLSSNGQLVADTVLGTGGNIRVAADRRLTVQTGAAISTSTAGRGSAGQILAIANSLYLTDGGRITSRSTAAGNAGAITLQVGDRLRVSAGEISAASERGGGGSINISARDILLNRSSLISSSVSDGSGGGGNITITARDIFLAFDDSDILANAQFGEGGNIRINAPIFIADLFANVGRNPGKDFSRFRGNDRVDISSSSVFGSSGSVQIPDISFIQNSLSSLDSSFVDPEQIVAGSCLARRNAEQGSFVVTGTGGLARNPYAQLSGNYSVVGVQSLNSASRKNPNPAPDRPPPQERTQNQPPTAPYLGWKPGDPIQEARGFITTPDGRVVMGTAPQLAAIAKAQDLVCHFANQP